MKYKIYSTDNWRDEDKLLADYPCLKDFGFEVGEEAYKTSKPIKDEKGNSIRQIVTSYRKAFYVTINDLDELMKFRDAVDESIIFLDGETIEIYDTYRE